MSENSFIEKKAIFNALIKDEVIEPYYIFLSNSSYELYKKVIRAKIDSGEQFEGKEFVGCYNDFSMLLRRLIFLKVNDKKTIYSLKEYLLEYEKISKEILLKIPNIKTF